VHPIRRDVHVDTAALAGSLRRYMPYLVGLFATLTLIYALAVLRLVPGMEISSSRSSL